MGFAEKDSPKTRIRGLRPYDTYELTWFKPETGKWLPDPVTIEVDNYGMIALPDYPDEFDWAFKLKKINTDLPIHIDYVDKAIENNRTSSTGMENVTFEYIETDSVK